jgi:enoyl-CoA hydratase
MAWAEYDGLTFEEHDDGVLLMTIVGCNRACSLNKRQLAEVREVWRDISDSKSVRVVVVTGKDNYFCSGGDLRVERTRTPGNFEEVIISLNDARDLVLNLLACNKVIVSAINGPAVGAGLAMALLADISIIGEGIKISDGHVSIGLAAGDHASIVWPLLCGMARAKYYLLTGEPIFGSQAAQIGLVSKCVPDDRVLGDALALAHRLASGSQLSLEWTKRSLNHWIRSATPIFESSLGLEMLGLFGPDIIEGLDAFLEKRKPSFGAGRARA